MQAGVTDRLGDFLPGLASQVVFNALPMRPIGLHPFTPRADVEGAVMGGHLLKRMVEFFRAVQ